MKMKTRMRWTWSPTVSDHPSSGRARGRNPSGGVTASLLSFPQRFGWSSRAFQLPCLGASRKTDPLPQALHNTALFLRHGLRLFLATRCSRGCQVRSALALGPDWLVWEVGQLGPRPGRHPAHILQSQFWTLHGQSLYRLRPPVRPSQKPPGAQSQGHLAPTAQVSPTPAHQDSSGALLHNP